MQKVNSDFCKKRKGSHGNSEYPSLDHRNNWSIMRKDDKKKNPIRQLLHTEPGNALSVQDVPLVCLYCFVQSPHILCLLEVNEADSSQLRDYEVVYIAVLVRRSFW